MGRLADMRMWGRISRLALAVLCCLYLAQSAPAACPSSDLTGDCFVDFEDFALLAAQWPTSDFNDIAAMAAHWLTTAACIPDDMTYILGGTFEMGDSFNESYSGERPVHTVTVDSFYMRKYEITNRQYCDYLNSAMSEGLVTVTSGVVYQAGSGTSYPYCDTYSASDYSQIDYNDVSGIFSVRTKSGRDMSNDPMVKVTWYGAAAYCNWRSRQEGRQECYNLSTWDCDFSKKGYRLPTEAEWEYAARGGLSGRRFPWGDTISHSQANYCSYWEGEHPYYSYDVSPTQGYHPAWYDIPPYTSPVGSFPVAGYGLYDMTGNVWEWCSDWWESDYYSSSPTNNPTGPTSGSSRVIRGGGWSYDADSCRVAYRGGYGPGNRGGRDGFRPVLDLN